jgi:hypothetical protein
MFYAIRGADGAIQTISRLPQANAELIPQAHPDIQSFLKLQATAPVFDAADAEFVRVIEDLIDTLIEKNIIRLTDLPVPAQKKLMMRKGLRNRMQGALDLLGDDDKIL